MGTGSSLLVGVELNGLGGGDEGDGDKGRESHVGLIVLLFLKL